MDENGLMLLKQEMANEEIHIKVNAIHRTKTVIMSIGEQETKDQLIPYFEGKFHINSPFSKIVVYLRIKYLNL